MKVKIGPYKEWLGPFQLAEKILFWKDKNEDETVHKFGEFLAFGFQKKANEQDFLRESRKKTWLHQFLYWIDSKIERKVDIRIDNYDTWNMCNTLAHIILPMLKQLKETKHGIPIIEPEMYCESNHQYPQLCFEFYKEDDDRSFEAGSKKWDEIMDKMIWSFEQINTDWEDQYHTGEIHFISVPIPGSTSVKLERGPNDTSKFDAKGHEEHAKKIQEGFDLFGKYYQHLWD